MLKGVEYAHSKEKRRFDLVAARLAQPFAHTAYVTLMLNSGENPIFMQKRIGANNVPFDLFKLRTLQEDDCTPIDNSAVVMRRTGLDELIQYKNILAGDMSMVARRPLTEHEDAVAFDNAPGATVDRYRQIVTPTKPGLVSSFVIATHLGKIPDANMHEERLEMNIKDVIDGSYINDTRLFVSVVTKGFTNQMKKGDIRPFKAE